MGTYESLEQVPAAGEVTSIVSAVGLVRFSGEADVSHEDRAANTRHSRYLPELKQR